MSYEAAPPIHAPVITLGETDRVAFMVKVYQHLALAVAAFVAFEYLMFATGGAERLYDLVFGTGVGWLMLLGLFMVATFITTQAAADLGNPARQYAGLFGTAAVEAVIFAPFLHYVFRVTDNAADVWSAAAITLVGFAGLTVVAWTTRRDLGFMRPLVMWGAVAAMGLIVASLLFGMELGVWFSVAMVGLAGAAILYNTQKILRTYPPQAYVVAAVSLFGSLMTMFWYVLRILTDR